MMDALADEKSRQLGAVAMDLLAHVVSVLEDNLARKAYGQVYAQILCKVLEVRSTKKVCIVVHFPLNITRAAPASGKDSHSPVMLHLGN